ncbi:MAG: type II secretion system F family protein [Armatimonadota bacterium]
MFGTAQARERAEVFGGLAAMVNAGVSIGESLTSVAEDMRPSPMQRALMQVGHAVSGGEPLGASLERHPDVFSPLTIAMIRVGESGGRLAEALRNVADYFERDFKLRSLLRRELTYPLILVIAILFIPLVGNMVRLWITESFGAALAAGAGQLFIYLVVLGVPAVLIGLLVRSLRQSRQGRERLDRMKLSIPLIGNVLRKLALARFCRALASLYSAGVLPGTALRLAGQASGNAVVERELGGKASAVEAGESLADALEGSALMPGTVIRMLKTGEQTGDVDAMAHNVAEHLEMETETSIKQMAVSITPVAVVIAGIIVALMVLGFYANLYSF